MVGSLDFLIQSQARISQLGASKYLPLRLTASDLANLIDYTEEAIGRTNGEPVSAENLKKALKTFRDNPLNQTFMQLIRRKYPQSKFLTPERRDLSGNRNSCNCGVFASQ